MSGVDVVVWLDKLMQEFAVKLSDPEDCTIRGGGCRVKIIDKAWQNWTAGNKVYGMVTMIWTEAVKGRKIQVWKFWNDERYQASHLFSALPKTLPKLTKKAKPPAKSFIWGRFSWQQFEEIHWLGWLGWSLSLDWPWVGREGVSSAF